jgi:hypothetical protein
MQRVLGSSAPERFTTVSDHVKPIHSCGSCSTVWSAVIRLVTLIASRWSWTRTKSTKRRLSGAGWQLIPASNYSGGRPIVPVPTRSNASLVTRMTK